jgi:hypothetical protein
MQITISPTEYRTMQLQTDSATLHAIKNCYSHSTLNLNELIARFGIQDELGFHAFLESPQGKKYKENILRDILELDALLQEKAVEMHKYELLKHRIAVGIALLQEMETEAKARYQLNAAVQVQLDNLHSKKVTKDTKAEQVPPMVKELIAIYESLEKNTESHLQSKLQEAQALFDELADLQEQEPLIQQYYAALSTVITQDVLNEATADNIESIIDKLNTQIEALLPKKPKNPEPEQPHASVESVLDLLRKHVTNLHSGEIYMMDKQGQRTSKLGDAAHLVPRQFQLVPHNNEILLFPAHKQVIIEGMAPEKLSAARNRYESQKVYFMNLPEFMQYHREQEVQYIYTKRAVLETRRETLLTDIAVLSHQLEQQHAAKNSLMNSLQPSMRPSPKPKSKVEEDSTTIMLKLMGKKPSKAVLDQVQKGGIKAAVDYLVEQHTMSDEELRKMYKKLRGHGVEESLISSLSPSGRG